MTLPTMNPGDRVRITVEGEFQERTGSCRYFKLDGEQGSATSFFDSELTAPTSRVEVLPPPIDPDVLVVREILHAHQRAMTPPDSGWGDMSYIKGSYDDLNDFKAALACFKASKAGGRV